jgi:hypothetical protein
MEDQGAFVLMVVGVVFIVLGLGTVIWGKREEKSYYNSLVTRKDLREFFSHWPKRPEPGSLKVGGWIAIAVGVAMAITAGALWLTG